MGNVLVSPAAEAGRVVEAVLRDLRGGDHRGVVVDSPPGAGKSTLVVRAAGELAATGAPLMIVAQTNEQVDDLIERLGARSPEVTVGRLSAVDYEPSDRVKEHPACRVGAKVADLGLRQPLQLLEILHAGIEIPIEQLAQDLQPHLEADEALEGAIVEVGGDALALALTGLFSGFLRLREVLVQNFDAALLALLGDREPRSQGTGDEHGRQQRQQGAKRQDGAEDRAEPADGGGTRRGHPGLRAAAAVFGGLASGWRARQRSPAARPRLAFWRAWWSPRR